jgi:hypothetical protein
VHRFHRHVTAAGPATTTRPLAVCYAVVLYVFRTLVGADIPDERGLSEAAWDQCAGRLDDQSALSGRGDRGQHRGQPVHRRRAVRRAWRAGRQPGHGEQLRLGQRPVQNYETICGGTGAGPGFDGASAVQVAHDQHPHDRPGSAGAALSRAGRGILDPPRLGRRRALAGRRRLGAAACASSSP